MTPQSNTSNLLDFEILLGLIKMPRSETLVKFIYQNLIFTQPASKQNEDLKVGEGNALELEDKAEEMY